jgi:drug/metabolite transporter (DMT)-like permease
MTAAILDRTPAPAYRTGVAFVLSAGVFWSLMGLLVRWTDEASVWQILFYRSLALGTFLFIVIAVRSRGRVWSTLCEGGMPIIFGGYALMMAFSGSIGALKGTTIANAMFLFATAPFMAAVLGRIILKEQVRPATWIAMSIAMVGIAIMVVEALSLGRMMGNVAAIISAFGFALFTIALRWRNTQDMFPALFLGALYTTLLSGAICWATGEGIAVSLNDGGMSVLMGVGLLGAGMMIFTYGSKAVPAAELALLSMTEVVLGPVWVWILLGETVGPFTLLGGAILLLAIGGNALSGLRRRPLPIGLR